MNSALKFTKTGPSNGHTTQQQAGTGYGARSLQAKTAIVLLTAAFLLALLYGLWIARVAILLIFAGILVAIVLNSLCAWVETKARLRRRWSLPLILLVLAGVLCFGMWLRGTAIETQVDQLQEKLPQAMRAVVLEIQDQQWGRWLVGHLGAGQLPRFADVLPKVTDALGKTAGFFGGIVIVIFLGIVIAAEPQSYRRGFERLFPQTSRAYVNYVLDEIAHALRWWLFARLLSMCAVGIMVFVGLWILGVPMSGTLGLLAALLAFIPNIGPILSAIPPTLLAFSRGPYLALFVVLLFMAVHAIEGFLVTPLAERAAVQLPPALTLSAQLVLAVLVGAMGIAFAAPLTTVAVVLIRTVYTRKVLNET